jgi:replicative DNA helicase
LYRPEYYKITEDEDGKSTEGIGEVIIAKNRAGTIDTIRLQFIGKFTKFANIGEYSVGSSVPNSFSQHSGISQFESQAVDPGFQTFKSKMNTDEETPTPNLDGEYPF